MRKFFVLLTVLVLGLILVSCGSDTSVKAHFVSVNKIVYTTSELDGQGNPNISADDFDYYLIRNNRTVTKQTVESTALRFTEISEGIIEVIVSNNARYRVYVYNDEAANPNDYAVSALSLNFGEVYDQLDSNAKLEHELEVVSDLFFTPMANKVDLSALNLLAARFGDQDETTFVYSEDETDTNAYQVDFSSSYEDDIFRMSSENAIVISTPDGEEAHTFINYTYKPADNSLPIHTGLQHNWMGYVWDFVFIIPISFVLQFFSGLFFNSFAVGIIFATLIVRTLAWPIYARTNDMSMKMALANPEIQKLQNKYATKKDPASQQKMQMEMMTLYKKHGISILGCFMPILQMPLFLAMFQVVQRIVVPGGMFVGNVSNTTLLFGLVDLTTGGPTDPWSYVLASIVGVTMFILQKLSSKKPSYAKNTGTQVKSTQSAQTEKTMKTVSTVMIAMMVFTSLLSPKALAFYWIIGNVYSIIQTRINRKRSEKKYEEARQQQTII